MTRPYIKAGITELTMLFERSKGDSSVLEQLFEELVQRRTKGARALLADIDKPCLGIPDRVDPDDRHLNRREIFKQNRSAALAEWRQLAA